MKIFKFILTVSLVFSLLLISTVYYKILEYGSSEEYCNQEYQKTGQCTFLVCTEEIIYDKSKCKPCLEDTECPCEKVSESYCRAKLFN